MRRHGDPWRDVSALLVDGNNVLYAWAGDPGPGPLHGLLARLAAAVPPRIETQVILDGAPDPGAPAATRIRPGLAVRHAGRRSADALLVELVEARPFFERAGVLVVTNDLALGERVGRAGGRARPVGWLAERLADRTTTAPPHGGSIAGPRPRRLRGASFPGGRPIGPAEPGGSWPAAGAPPTGARPTAKRPDRSEGDPDVAPPNADADEAEREPWRPGRGATRKRGNPRRGH